MRASIATNSLRLSRINPRYYSGLTHVDAATGTPKMVDVSEKQISKRIAHAQAYVILPEGLLDNLSHSKGDAGNDEIFAKKGPVFATAVVSGVMAAKKTSDFIPFCHQVGLDRCDIDIRFDDTARNRIRIDCTVSCTHKTGVEMEALVGASHAALTIYDMMKALSHSIEITEVKLIKKTGGKSDYLAAS